MTFDLMPHADYLDAWPFPHAILDGIWPDDLLDRVVAEVPAASHPGWRRFSNALEVKLEGSDAGMWGPATYELANHLSGDEFRQALTAMTGIADLVCSFVGGGYHRIEPAPGDLGGRLGVHTDFNHLDGLGWRRLNVLVYLNRDWPGGNGGELELWPVHDGAPTSLGSVDVEPWFNRTVVFTTSDRSWHGHPSVLTGDRARLSFAAYYFTADRPDDASDPHDTVFAQ